ncbi:hypothetical protein ARTSIC4J27_3038 [Pseudarthrobacter siccitolerans]|uniref:Uncharacterized protein n=1 Tax=Pseudarthrobacter siccitolerans TaxID=861266 RepID=A0A024H4I0_9MICC|nr:hypothetical protein ARTSIC4J27_3038 [Pseudarthrobacter siccitolerans]
MAVPADPAEGTPGLVMLWLCTLHALPVLVLGCKRKQARKRFLDAFHPYGLPRTLSTPAAESLPANPLTLRSAP